MAEAEVARLERGEQWALAVESDGWSVYEALCDEIEDDSESEFLGRLNPGQAAVFVLGEIARQSLWNGVLGGLRNLDPAVTLRARDVATTVGDDALAEILREAIGLIDGYGSADADQTCVELRAMDYTPSWESLDDRFDGIGVDLMAAVQAFDHDLWAD